MDDVWWTTPTPRLSEAQKEAASYNDRMALELFRVLLRELDGCTIEDLIDVAGLVDR